MIDFVKVKTFLYIAKLVNSKYLLEILYKLAESHIMPGTNSYTAGCHTSRKYTRISIFKVPKAKSGMPEHKNGKKNIWTSIFFRS